MYKTDFIVRYNDIENELVKRLERRLAEEVAAEFTTAIQSAFNMANVNIITNVNGNKISETNSNVKAIATATTNATTTNATTTNATTTNATTTNATTNASTDKEVKKRGRKSKKVLEEERIALEKRLEEERIALEKDGLKVADGLPVANSLSDDSDDDDDMSDYKYTRQDIAYICDKLYRDELISSFDADSLDDPKMDAGIQMVFERLIKHDEFKQFLLELSTQVMDISKAKTEQDFLNLKRNSDYLIFITMFSQQVFYLTHQCICKMIVDGHVGPELMGELKEKLMKIFSYCK
jgi:hypothetical protein